MSQRRRGPTRTSINEPDKPGRLVCRCGHVELTRNPVARNCALCGSRMTYVEEKGDAE